MNFIKHLKALYNTFLERSNNTHKNVIMALIMKLADLESDLGLMLSELCIHSATGSWLDEWGSWFGVYRRRNEKDGEYSERIIISIKAPKSTIQAIKEHSANFLNYEYNNGHGETYTVDDIVVFEPWSKLAVYSQCGTLSGTHRFPDSVYWRHSIIDISIPESITKEFIDMINHVKAAGIQVSYTVRAFGFTVVAFHDGSALNNSDSTLLLENYIKRSVSGMILSGSVFMAGMLSGKRVIWGTDRTEFNDLIEIDFFRDWNNSALFRKCTLLEVPIRRKIDLSYTPWDWHSNVKTVMDAFERFWGLSIAQMCDCTTPYINAHNALSAEYGLLSGVPGKISVLITDANDLTRYEQRHIMPAVQRDVFFLSSHIMSVQSRLSSNVSLSGAYKEKGLYTRYHSTADTLYNSSDAYTVRELESKVITQLTFFGDRGSKLLSGRQSLWSHDFISVNIKVNDTLNWHSPITTVNDVLELYGNTTVYEACLGLKYSYPVM